jgi:hypothetical protein
MAEQKLEGISQQPQHFLPQGKNKITEQNICLQTWCADLAVSLSAVACGVKVVSHGAGQGEAGTLRTVVALGTLVTCRPVERCGQVG